MGFTFTCAAGLAAEGRDGGGLVLSTGTAGGGAEGLVFWGLGFEGGAEGAEPGLNAAGGAARGGYMLLYCP